MDILPALLISSPQCDMYNLYPGKGIPTERDLHKTKDNCLWPFLSVLPDCAASIYLLISSVILSHRIMIKIKQADMS